jgi:hypothetical protein
LWLRGKAARPAGDDRLLIAADRAGRVIDESGVEGEVAAVCAALDDMAALEAEAPDHQLVLPPFDRSKDRCDLIHRLLRHWGRGIRLEGSAHLSTYDSDGSTEGGQ